MTRLVLALVAILLLAWSAGLAPTQLRQVPLSQRQVADGALLRDELAVARADLSLVQARGQAAARPALPTSDDTPAPALVIYLALVVIGSGVAVALVRYHQRQQIP
jgi:hypothetical protein